MKNGDGEPYLADMVAVTASLINGIFGITPTWDRLKVTPRLPSGWPQAEADILYKGQRHRVTIRDRSVHIQPLEQVLALPLLWVMDFNLRSLPGGVATTANVDLPGPYGDSITLKRTCDDRGALGLWKLDESSGVVRDASPHQRHGKIAGKGIQQGVAGHKPTGKGCRFSGEGRVDIADDAGLSFHHTQSFTVQCWFKTEATDSRVMLGKPGAYCVHAKNGKLAAWLMQDGGQFKEALGSHPVVAGEGADARASQLRPRRAGHQAVARGDVLQPSEAAERLGQAVEVLARRAPDRRIDRLDGGDGLLEPAHARIPFVLTAETPRRRVVSGRC
jgi:hypothetical protein